MCGVFGYDGVAPVDVSLLSIVAKLAARRGPHACGIAWDFGGKVQVRRWGQPWEQVAGDALVIVRGHKHIIGHCRLSTSGSHKVAANNQPIPAGQGAVAHNGNVLNHHELAARDGIKLITDCDSELLAHWALTDAVDVALARTGEPGVLLGLWPGRVAYARRALPLFAWKVGGGTYYCSVQPNEAATLVEEINVTKKAIPIVGTRTQPADHPLSTLEWRKPSDLHSNLYNPNRVFPAELELLKLSIIEDGWTQPIVIRADGTIVDGFHRWTISQTPEIAALTGGLVPCVVLRETDDVHQMMATVRHNRARGQHGILKMSEIVRAAQASGLDEDAICAGFGMEPEEIDRLADMRASPEHAGKDSFGRGWVPSPEVPKPVEK